MPSMIAWFSNGKEEDWYRRYWYSATAFTELRTEFFFGRAMGTAIDALPNHSVASLPPKSPASVAVWPKSCPCTEPERVTCDARSRTVRRLMIEALPPGP